MTNLDCGTCNDRIMINVNGANYSDLQIEIGLTENNINSQGYTVNGFNFSEHNSEYSEQSNYLFGGVNYDVVRVFEKKVTSDRFIKLIVAKGVGIVGMVEKNGTVWIIESALLKSSDSESVEIINTSCG